MQVEIVSSAELWFDTGQPVRAASAVAPFGDGWLIAQDDATHAAWHRPGSTTAVRTFPPVSGHDTFSSAAGTKHLKPDVESAVALGRDAVLLLGSGSAPARKRASLVRAVGPSTTFGTAELTPLYATVAAALGIAEDRLNLEGACVAGGRLRWFQRGNAAAEVDSAAVDLDLDALLAVLAGRGDAGAVQVLATRGYDLGSVHGVTLAITDAVALPDGRILLSTAAEDTPNAYDDGPVVGAALALLDGDEVVAVEPLPGTADGPVKIEGLALRGAGSCAAEFVAVVDADDPERASAELLLQVRW